MNLFIIITILLFFGIFCYLFLEIYNLKSQHRLEIANLNGIISELLHVQSQREGALKLSDDLNGILKNSRVEIDKKLLNLQGELIEKLVNNNLIS